MKNFVKIILSSVIALTIFATFFQTSFAETTTKQVKPTDKATQDQQYSLKDLKYDVNKELTIPDTTNGTSQQPKTYFSDTTNSPIVSFILKLIEYATTIIGTIAMIIFIIAGFMFMIAQGDQTKVDKAKEIFKYAIYGLLITFLSYVIVIFAQSLFITQSVTTPTNTTNEK